MDSRADPDAGAGPVADDSAPFDDGVFGRQPGSRDYRSHGTEAADFSISHASLLESSIGVLRTWLAGVLDGAAAQAVEVEPPAAFETRINDELTRSKKAPRETGLIDRPGARPAATRHTSAINVPSPVVRQLRATDVLGRLKTGEICVLLSDTTAEGTSFTATRLLQQLAALARQHDLPGVKVGATTFGAADESVADVLARAQADAKRRSGEQE